MTPAVKEPGPPVPFYKDMYFRRREGAEVHREPAVLDYTAQVAQLSLAVETAVGGERPVGPRAALPGRRVEPPFREYLDEHVAVGRPP